jgi:hypothetical protein
LDYLPRCRRNFFSSSKYEVLTRNWEKSEKLTEKKRRLLPPRVNIIPLLHRNEPAYNKFEKIDHLPTHLDEVDRRCNLEMACWRDENHWSDSGDFEA